MILDSHLTELIVQRGVTPHEKAVYNADGDVELSFSKAQLLLLVRVTRTVVTFIVRALIEVGSRLLVLAAYFAFLLAQT